MPRESTSSVDVAVNLARVSSACGMSIVRMAQPEISRSVTFAAPRFR